MGHRRQPVECEDAHTRKYKIFLTLSFKLFFLSLSYTHATAQGNKCPCCAAYSPYRSTTQHYVAIPPLTRPGDTLLLPVRYNTSTFPTDPGDAHTMTSLDSGPMIGPRAPSLPPHQGLRKARKQCLDEVFTTPSRTEKDQSGMVITSIFHLIASTPRGHCMRKGMITLVPPLKTLIFAPRYKPRGEILRAWYFIFSVREF